MCLRSSRSPATSRIASLNFDAPFSSIHSSRPSSPDFVSLIDGGELCGGVTSGRGSTNHESRVVGVPGETASGGGGDGARFASGFASGAPRSSFFGGGALGGVAPMARWNCSPLDSRRAGFGGGGACAVRPKSRRLAVLFYYKTELVLVDDLGALERDAPARAGPRRAGLVEGRLVVL